MKQFPMLSKAVAMKAIEKCIMTGHKIPVSHATPFTALKYPGAFRVNPRLRENTPKEGFAILAAHYLSKTMAEVKKSTVDEDEANRSFRRYIFARAGKMAGTEKAIN